MNLLKSNETVPQKLYKVDIINLPNDVKLSIKSGWHFGIGFGLAMVIAIPAILLLLSFIIVIGFLMIGSSLGALF